jgi:hypothetical protein
MAGSPVKHKIIFIINQDKYNFFMSNVKRLDEEKDNLKRNFCPKKRLGALAGINFPTKALYILDIAKFLFW